jgi:hypothetical protein
MSKDVFLGIIAMCMVTIATSVFLYVKSANAPKVVRLQVEIVDGAEEVAK